MAIDITTSTNTTIIIFVIDLIVIIIIMIIIIIIIVVVVKAFPSCTIKLNTYGQRHKLYRASITESLLTGKTS